jgi:hypothetical protein
MKRPSRRLEHERGRASEGIPKELPGVRVRLPATLKHCRYLPIWEFGSHDNGGERVLEVDEGVFLVIRWFDESVLVLALPVGKLEKEERADVFA